MSRTIRLTRELLAERAARVRKINARIASAGMTRPARPPEKGASLERMGGSGPFAEGPMPRPTEQPGRRS